VSWLLSSRLALRLEALHTRNSLPEGLGWRRTERPRVEQEILENPKLHRCLSRDYSPRHRRQLPGPGYDPLKQVIQMGAGQGLLLLPTADRLSPGTARQGRQQRGGGVAEEMDRAVGEQKMGAAGVKAPEVEHVALVAHPAVGEFVRSRRARAGGDHQDVLFFDPEDHVGRAGEFLARAGVPPAELEVGAGRPFADQEGVAGAVGDVAQANLGVAEQDAIERGIIAAADAQVAGEGDGDLVARGELRLEDARIGGAGVDRHDGGHRHMQRVEQRIGVDLVGGDGAVPELLLFDEGEDLREPARHAHGVFAVLVAHAGRQRLLRAVVVMNGEADLLEVIGTFDATGGGPNLLHCGDDQGDENRNDADDDEEFNQGESAAGHDLIPLQSTSRT
jgi:hypothetical protein